MYCDCPIYTVIVLEIFLSRRLSEITQDTMHYSFKNVKSFMNKINFKMKA